MKGRKSKSESRMGRATLASLIAFYKGDMQRRNLRPDSVEGSERALLRFARWLPNGPDTRLVDVTQERAREYLVHLQSRTARYENHGYKNKEEGPLSPFTIRRQIKELKVFGNWLKREDFSDPFDRLTLPKTPKRTVDILSDEEINQLLSAINPQTEQGGRAYAIISLMLDSGLRISEVAAAQLADLDLERRQLKVLGKGQKERYVPFGTTCAKSLQRYIELCRPTPKRPEPEADRLFLSLDGEPMTRNGLETIISRLRARSGVARLHAHLLRHTFATRFLDNGGQLEDLQSIMGHEELTTTQIYLHFTKQRAVARYQGRSVLDNMPLAGTGRRFGYKPRRKANSRDT